MVKITQREICPLNKIEVQNPPLSAPGSVVQQLSRIYSFCIIKTLCPLDSGSVLPCPSPLAPTSGLWLPSEKLGTSLPGSSILNCLFSSQGHHGKYTQAFVSHYKHLALILLQTQLLPSLWGQCLREPLAQEQIFHNQNLCAGHLKPVPWKKERKKPPPRAKFKKWCQPRKWELNKGNLASGGLRSYTDFPLGLFLLNWWRRTQMPDRLGGKLWKTHRQALEKAPFMVPTRWDIFVLGPFVFLTQPSITPSAKKSSPSWSNMGNVCLFQDLILKSNWGFIRDAISLVFQSFPVATGGMLLAC